jgi:hypothetical protein
MFELFLCVDYSVFGVTRAGLLSCCLWSPFVSLKAESCQERAQMLWRVILDSKAESQTYSHLGEAVFTQLWWI